MKTNENKFPENMQQVIAFIKELMPEIQALKLNREGDLDEYLQNVLLEKLSSMSQTEAEAIINEMKAGIQSFEDSYKEAQNDEGFAIRLNTKLEGCEEQEKHNYLVNVLTAMQCYEGGVKADEADIEKQLEKNKLKTDDELLSEIETLAQNLINASAILTLFTDDNAAKASEIIRQTAFGYSKEDKLYIAVALMVAQRSGRISLDVPAESQDRIFGTYAAAASEIMHASQEYSEGKIELSTWQRIVKYTLATLLFLGLVSLIAIIGYFVSFALVMTVVSVLGTGFFGCLIALILGAAIMFPACSWLGESVWGLFEKLSAPFDSLITRLTEFVKTKFQAFGNLREKIKGGEETVSEAATVSEQPLQEDSSLDEANKQTILA